MTKAAVPLQPGTVADFSRSLALQLPAIRSRDRPKPTEALQGAIIYNTTLGRLQFCDGHAWRKIPAV